MTDRFDGFPKAGLDFLAELGTRDKRWFDANRKTYDTALVAPTKAFVSAVGDRLADGMAPGIVALPKANGSISPINNDLRFSPDKSLYKDHLLLRFWEGPDKKTSPTLFIRLSKNGVGFGSGIALTRLDRWRELIDNDKTGPSLAKAIETLGKKHEIDVAGEGYKRVPKPYDQNHPRAALLKHKMFQVRWSEPTPKDVLSPEFVDFCASRLGDCAPIHHWMVENL